MDGWNTSFLLGWPMFRCYVSFGEGIYLSIHSLIPPLFILSIVFPSLRLHFMYNTAVWERTLCFNMCFMHQTYTAGLMTKINEPGINASNHQFFCRTADSKNFPTYPWNVPQTPNQQFLKEFLPFGGFGDARGVTHGPQGIGLRFKGRANGSFNEEAPTFLGSWCCQGVVGWPVG